MPGFPFNTATNISDPGSRTGESTYRREPENITTTPVKAQHPTRSRMLCFSVIIALAAILAGGTFALSSNQSTGNTSNAEPLPVVDLGYTVHQAASLNVSGWSLWKH